MIKNHRQSQIGNPLPQLHRLIYLISSKDSFICIIPQKGYYISKPLLYQSWSTERNIPQWAHHVGSIQRPIAP